MRQEADIALSDQAIEWLVRLQSGHATDADWDGFEAWRQTSDEHELAAQEAEAIWQGLGPAGEMTRRTAKRRVTRRTVIGGAAALVCGIAIERSGLLRGADHVTGVGEQRAIMLSDGSQVEMNAGTALSVDMAGRERRLTLHQGQATFSVAHDPARPFTVAAREGRTRALGTVFDIDMRPREVVVTVMEGAVRVTSEAAPGAAVTTAADQRTRYGAQGAPAPAEAVESDVETAWRRGKLIFRQRPLGDVVAEIERHRSGTILIASAPLRDLPVTGVFNLDEPELILETIQETLPVRITRLPLVTILR